MSTAEQPGNHYFQLHGLRAQAPQALNAALKVAIGQLQTNLYGPAKSELTPAEIALFDRVGVDLDEHPEQDDPLLEYATEFAAILATSLTPTKAAELIERTPVRVRQLIRQNELYAIRVASRWHVPTFQFDGNALIPNIVLLNPELAELDPVSVVRWYTSKDPELEDSNGNTLTPLEWLKTGHDAQKLIKIVPEA